MTRPACLSSVYILALLGLALPGLRSAPEPVPEDTCEPAALDPRLFGVWHRFEALSEGDRLRFYFFHEGGFGLYRYGKVGLTNTHSFDYSAEGGALELNFRKTGERRRVPYRIEAEGGRTWLVLDDDPREPGGARYFRAEPDARGLGPDLGAPELGALAGLDPGACTDLSPSAGGAIGNRLWGDEVRHATGGMAFSIYQLQAQAIDGRGVGWHHRGDYDEWTTETLSYRQRGDALALDFPLRHESARTAIALTGSGDERRLRLDDDPRDFWRAHTYRDMGPSFACQAP